MANTHKPSTPVASHGSRKVSSILINISPYHSQNTQTIMSKSLQEQLLGAKLIDEKKPDTFNQAIIEFGALHCTPTSPSCDSCPFSDSCFAFTESRIKDFPVKLKKKKPVERFLNFYLVKQKFNKRSIDFISSCAR